MRPDTRHSRQHAQKPSNADPSPDLNPAYPQHPIHQLQRLYGNQAVRRMLTSHTHPHAIQRTITVTGENNNEPLLQGTIRSNNGLLQAVTQYPALRSLLINHVQAMAGDNNNRPAYTNWASLVADAGSELVSKAITRRDENLFDNLFDNGVDMETWRDPANKLDVLTFLYQETQKNPNDAPLLGILNNVKSRHGKASRNAQINTPHGLSPATHALPVLRELQDNADNSGYFYVEAACLRLIASIRSFNFHLRLPGEAELFLDFLLDIDSIIEELMAYDKPTGVSPIPVPFAIELQSYRQLVTARRRILNDHTANALQFTTRMGAGKRPDRHKSYNDLNPQALLGNNTPQYQAYQSQITQGSIDQDQNADKTKEEAWTAATAAATYPGFTQIKGAARIPGRIGNVEYYDNQGNPWDQKGAFRHSDEHAVTSMNNVVQQIVDQQKVNFPKRNSTVEVPVGVLLDTTYINEREYQLMWSMIFKRARQGDIDLARLKEVRSGILMNSLPSLRLDTTNFDPAATEANRGATQNVSRLDGWKNNGATQQITGQDGQIRTFQTIPAQTLKVQAQEKANIMTAILNGTHDAFKVFHNSNGVLPGGQRYLEYSVPSTVLADAENKARIVRGSGGDAYITGTHYESWTKTVDNSAQVPFYKIT